MSGQPNTLTDRVTEENRVDPGVVVVRSKPKPPRKTCPYCGERVRFDSPWCHSCGRNLTRSPADKDSLPSSPPHASAARSSSTAQSNPCAGIGLLLGITAIFLYELGIIPLLGLVLSVIGRILAGRRRGKGRIQAEIGIALNVLYFVMFFLHLYRYV